MQVPAVCSEQGSAFFPFRNLATIRSLDKSNDWVEYKFSLRRFAGQKIYLAPRYRMNTSIDGLLC
ncbi:MAG: hypothetical protein IPI04_18280 [Ignavibacteria bacterium]|nr:hypothetical protein [Ignavibacteria bacterium]